MIRRPAVQGLITMACVLALGGCSAVRDGNQATSRGDDRMRLAPDPAYAGARIAVVFADLGVRADRCRFEWRRNRQLIPDARTGVLEPVYFAKGDRIEVAVVDPGAKPGDQRRLHAAVEVANTPPTIARVTVLPSGISGRAELRAVPEGLDRDGDGLTYAYRWFKNGSLMAAETGPSLPMASLAIGEPIAVEVVASDGESDSPPVRGEAVPIENHPPHFTSQAAAPRPADSLFHYQAVATDDDRDPLRYELVNGPPGMVVNPNGGVSWTLPAGAWRAGEYPVTIRALDPKGGEATQQFTIRLDSPVAKR